MQSNYIDLKRIESIEIDFGFEMDGDRVKPITTIHILNENGEMFTKKRYGNSGKDLQQQFAVIFQLLSENEKYVAKMMEEEKKDND